MKADCILSSTPREVHTNNKVAELSRSVWIHVFGWCGKWAGFSDQSIVNIHLNTSLYTYKWSIEIL
jgi:hypothetical protein